MRIIHDVPLTALIADASNARNHDERNLEAIAESLSSFGQVEPLVCKLEGDPTDKKFRVLGGNGRLTAMDSLGWKAATICVYEGSDANARKLAIALNRTAELATWDDAALLEQLHALDVKEAEDLGFNKKDIQAIERAIVDATGGEEGQGIRDRDAATAFGAPKDAVTKTGDVWILGKSRIICGDSTKSDTYERLMRGQKADMCSTDPPYICGYTSSSATFQVNKDGKRGMKGGKFEGTYNEIKEEDGPAFYRDLFTNVLAHSKPDAALYCWLTHKRVGMLQTAWADLKILDHMGVVWVKPTPVVAYLTYLPQFEYCMVGWLQGNKPLHLPGSEMSNVWHMEWEGGKKSAPMKDEHPTQKPLAIFETPMRKHTNVGDLCLEPFSGSGTQLIAAESMKRRCYAIEMAPQFVDVAVKRWQHATSNEATLEDTGKTFAEMEALRMPATKKAKDARALDEEAGLDDAPDLAEIEAIL